MTLPVLLACACLFLSTCGGGDSSRTETPAMVSEQWQRYERDFSEFRKWSSSSAGSDLEKVRTELWELTGIRLDATSEAAFTATRAQIEEWYALNQSRLYWDVKGKRIDICRLGTSRGGAALGMKAVDPVWQAHISVMEDLAAGRSFQLEEFADAWRFFLAVTQMVIPADHGPVVDLIPVAESKAALPLLKSWYSRNADRLRWDKNTGTIVLKD